MEKAAITARTALFAAALVAALCGCRRTDVRDFEIKVPELTRENSSRIVGALMGYDGVRDVAKLQKNTIVIDEPAHTVKVKYDSMKVAKKNLEMAIARAGYEANGVTPESVGAKRASTAEAKPAEAK